MTHLPSFIGRNRIIVVVTALLLFNSSFLMANSDKPSEPSPVTELNTEQELSDSTKLVLEIFNSAINVTEQNNAIFPVLMRCGFESEYKALKDSIYSLVKTQGISADEAVGRYIYWFYYNFDRHNNCSSDYFYKMMPIGFVNYQEVIPEYDPQPMGCKVDDNTYLLRLPSCAGDTPTMDWLLKKKDEFLQSKCEYLILDIRGNAGGSDEYSLMFTEFMCDCNAMNDNATMYMNSTENNKMLKKMHEDNPDTLFQHVLEEAATTPAGTLINWISEPKGTEDYTPKVRKGAIIIDNFTASSGESPIRMVRIYSKSHALVYGRENTFGADKSGNCNSITLPNTDITIQYPAVVDLDLEKTCKSRKPGHTPDVIIPLPYPSKVTDNIDEWVLWVAKDMKTR